MYIYVQKVCKQGLEEVTAHGQKVFQHLTEKYKRTLLFSLIQQDIT